MQMAWTWTSVGANERESILVDVGDLWELETQLSTDVVERKKELNMTPIVFYSIEHLGEGWCHDLRWRKQSSRI